MDCVCVFCNSRCPGCGSINIEVEGKIHFEYTNTIDSSIHIRRWLDGLEIHCRDCEKGFGWGGEASEGLAGALSQGLGTNDLLFQCDDHGDVTSFNLVAAGG
jgi:hypothetical protein